MTTKKTRYRLIRRGVRSNAFYCVDTTTGKRNSLRTGSEEEAQQIIEALMNTKQGANQVRWCTVLKDRALV